MITLQSLGPAILIRIRSGVATSIVRSPTALLSRTFTVSDQKPRPTVQISQLPLKRRRFTPLLSSFHDDDDDNNGSNNKITKASGWISFSRTCLRTSSSKTPLCIRFSDSVSDGSCLRVAYQGVCGAYGEAAAEKAYPNYEAVPCDQFDAALEAVEKWLVDRTVLPIENSLGGSIHRNYDLLLCHSLHTVGEVKLAVFHCLPANHGVQVEDLKRVLTHPEALAQCVNTLTKIGLSREAVDSTALPAENVAFCKLKDKGAVASSSAARIYGLNILAQDVKDDCDHVTRFLMLAREPIIPGITEPLKTSIVFSLEEDPGVLFKALAVFALRQINLTKIENRPLKNQPLQASNDSNNHSKYFDYLFCVDFKASMAEERAQDALRHLKEFATFLRVLGSYLVGTTMI